MKKPRDYLNVVNIPEQKVGEWEIKHSFAKAREPLALVNGRTAIMGGHRGEALRFDHPTRWHELKQGSGPGRWMSDLPIEQAQIDREVKPIRSGSVLVGGLGIGYVASILARRPGIKLVTVVERSPEVVQLVSEHVCKGEAVRSKLHFVEADLFPYLASLSAGSFDHAYYDIWTNDGEATFFSTVMPLLRLSAARIRKEPINWNESVMRGQLHMSLDTRARVARMLAAPPTTGLTPEKQNEIDTFRAGMAKTWGSFEELCTASDNTWKDWSLGFFRWVRNAKPNDSVFEMYAAIYAGQYGRRGFEARWKALTGQEVLRCEITRRADEE